MSPVFSRTDVVIWNSGVRLTAALYHRLNAKLLLNSILTRTTRSIFPQIRIEPLFFDKPPLCLLCCLLKKILLSYF